MSVRNTNACLQKLGVPSSVAGRLRRLRRRGEVADAAQEERPRIVRPETLGLNVDREREVPSHAQLHGVADALGISVHAIHAVRCASVRRSNVIELEIDE